MMDRLLLRLPRRASCSVAQEKSPLPAEKAASRNIYVSYESKAQLTLYMDEQSPNE